MGAPSKPRHRKARMTPSEIQFDLNDWRPKVMLPGDDRILSAVAEDCGDHLQGMFFVRNGEVLLVEEGEAKRITPQRFRTEVENHVIFYREKRSRDGAIYPNCTMFESEAAGILASPQFTSKLRPLKRIHSPRLPVLRSDRTIELLPTGYDPETRILTLGTPAFQENMTVSDARAVIDDLLSEFEFGDETRSRAVSVAGLVGMVGIGLLPSGSLRPVFIVTKNAEGAGATTLARCIVWPIVGSAAATTLPDEDAETRKLLLTAALDARPAVILDNVKHKIGGAALEAFTSASVYEGRRLGANESIRCPHSTTVICTANGASVTPDMRRRSLFIELHLSVERAEDRRFRRPITDSVLSEFRPQVLAAVWALIRHWDEIGRPAPSRTHSSFPEWAQVVGGIVESSGYGCPFETPQKVVETVDEDAAAMRDLVAAMELGRRYNNRELIDLCRSEDLFSGLVGRPEDEMDRSRRSAWGRMLSRYHARAVGEHRFFSEGKEHKKRFWVERIHTDQHGLHGQHGVPASSTYTRVGPPNSGEDHADHATMQGFESMQGQHALPLRSDDVSLSTAPNGKDHATMLGGPVEATPATSNGRTRI